MQEPIYAAHPGLAYLLGDVPKEADVQDGAAQEKQKDEAEEDPSMCRLEHAPCALTAAGVPIGSAVRSQHRVVQVCVGAQHGILLSDAGIAFTWGDNRYGQLGRTSCHKEEDDKPFPVIDLQHEEVTQVAAGTHHCLALVAPGLVWAWGRNKCGQLGVGDYRDKVSPNKVCIVPAGGGAEIQLGSQEKGSAGDQKDDRRQIITTISAGANSSTAAALNSSVWQWGEISKDFKEKPDDNKKDGGFSLRRATAKKQEQRAEPSVQRNRPFCIFQKSQFMTTLRSRQEKISIADTGCMVLRRDGKDMSQEEIRKLKALLERVKEHQDTIIDKRSEVGSMLRERKSLRDGAGSKGARASDANDVHDLQDTIAMLDREISVIDRDIDLLQKNQDSCDLTQKHNRDQIQSLTLQDAKLNEKTDDYNRQLIDVRSGAQKQRLEHQLMENKEFTEASKNTRMTLLDQRAQTDMEKQRIMHALTRKREQRDKFFKRIQTVRDLSKKAASSSGTSDVLLNYLRELKDDISAHFANALAESKSQDFDDAMKQSEDNSKFLGGIELRMQEMVNNNSDAKRPDRAKRVQEILMDLVNLQRSWNSLLEDKWMKEDRDCSSFWKAADDSGRPPNAGGGQLALSNVAQTSAYGGYGAPQLTNGRP